MAEIQESAPVATSAGGSGFMGSQGKSQQIDIKSDLQSENCRDHMEIDMVPHCFWNLRNDRASDSKDAPCPLPVGPAFAKKKGAPKMKAEKATKHQNKSNASSEQKGNTIAYSYAVKNSWYNVNIHCIWTYISINYIL